MTADPTWLRKRKRATCGDKVRHRNRAAAIQHAAALLAKTGDVTRPYRCPFCERWHVGHPEGR